LKGAPWRERGARDLGEWGLAVRQVAHWDADRIERVWHWPLRELLLAYLARLRAEAQRRYEFDLALWAALAPHQKRPGAPPRPPRLLRG